jgi:Ca-activated chloride channel family protein
VRYSAQYYVEHLKAVRAGPWIRKVAIAVLLAAALRAQDVPTIHVPVRLVTLPTLVLANDGRVIAGLERNNFRVSDNGRPQKVTLDSVATPASVAVVVQVSRDVREYVPFIARVGSAVDALLVGERGQAAVIAYNEDVVLVKAFGEGNVRTALRRISASGRKARMNDAGVRAIEMLKDRPRARARILLYVGQPLDSGSEHSVVDVREAAERENVSIYALTLPISGKTFVSDTFSLPMLNLRRLIPSLNRERAGSDPFATLTAATGGTQLHFRKQSELEEAIAIVGVELRSSYVLSYRPSAGENGYHTINIEVDVPGAKAYSRPGYWWTAE